MISRNTYTPMQTVLGYIVGCKATFDKVQIWLETPLTESQQLPLYEYRGGDVDVFNMTMPMTLQWNQKIVLNQPTDVQLQYLKDVIEGGI